MLRIVSAAIRGIAIGTNGQSVIAKVNPDLTQYRSFGALSSIVQKWSIQDTKSKQLMNQVSATSPFLQSPQLLETPIRTATKFSRKNGKRKTVGAVIDRFYRLDWGIWIRTMAGRRSRLWLKSKARKRRLQYHVFCNATQSHMLDKMVSNYWRRPKYFVDDPYNPYHKREEFIITRKTPVP